MFRSCLSCIPLGFCFRGVVSAENTNKTESTAQIGTYSRVEFVTPLVKKNLLVPSQPIVNNDDSESQIKINYIPIPKLIIPQSINNQNGDGSVDISGASGCIIISSAPSSTIPDFLNDGSAPSRPPSKPRVLNVKVFQGDPAGRKWA